MSKKQLDKWRFAIGTTSRVPDSGGLHYLIADFDSYNVHLNLYSGILCDVHNLILQKTEHGFHLYTDQQMNFGQLVRTLRAMGADSNWIDIGKDRGYFFLADKQRINFPWPVEHMVIHHGTKKTQNSKTS